MISEPVFSAAHTGIVDTPNTITVLKKANVPTFMLFSAGNFPIIVTTGAQ